MGYGMSRYQRWSENLALAANDRFPPFGAIECTTAKVLDGLVAEVHRIAAWTKRMLARRTSAQRTKRQSEPCSDQNRCSIHSIMRQSDGLVHVDANAVHEAFFTLNLIAKSPIESQILGK